jgi:hypothetical protein
MRAAATQRFAPYVQSLRLCVKYSSRKGAELKPKAQRKTEGSFVNAGLNILSGSEACFPKSGNAGCCRVAAEAGKAAENREKLSF